MSPLVTRLAGLLSLHAASTKWLKLRVVGVEEELSHHQQTVMTADIGRMYIREIAVIKQVCVSVCCVLSCRPLP